MLEKYTFDIQAPKIKKKKIILAKSHEERREHVVMKLLAYMIYYDKRLLIEQSVGMHYKPDLVIAEENTVPELWIDCGQVAIKKLDSLSRKLKNSRIVIVKEDQSTMERFKKSSFKKVQYPDRIECLSFESGFISAVSESLLKNNEVTLYDVLEGVIGLAINEQIFESRTYFSKLSSSDLSLE